MSVPNYLGDVQSAKIKYPDSWAHAHHAGDPRTLEFIKLLAKDLHAKDPRVNLNGKRGDPSNLSADAINILCNKEDSDGRTPEGLACVVVDVIGGAGGPNPQPTWGVFNTFIEGSGAAVNPNGAPSPPQPPVVTMPDYEALGGDHYFRQAIGVPLQADMAEAGQTLNDGSSVWFSRPIFRILHAYASGQIPDKTAIIKSVRNEWRVILGLPPLP